MKKLLIAACLAAMAIPAGAASAAPGHQAAYTRQNDRHDERRVERRVEVTRTYVVNGRRYQAQRAAWNAPRGYHQRSWRAGQVVPVAYRGGVVRNYVAYHLPRPNRAQQWVRLGDDMLLINQRTGAIALIIPNVFF